MDYRETARAIKQDSVKLGALGCEVRNGALYAIKKALIENKEAIFEANREDMEQAKRESLPAPILGRLKFDEHKLDDVTSGIESLISIKDPIKQTVFRRELDEGLGSKE